MSLTRQEWEDMWRAIKYIEVNATDVFPDQWQAMDKAIKFIKKKIEQVIGQQE